MNQPPRRFGPPPPRAVASPKSAESMKTGQRPRPQGPPRRPARSVHPVGRRIAKKRRSMVLGRLQHRATTGFAAVCLLLAVIGARLVQLQGIDHSNYADAAAQQRSGSVELNALRGQIVDRNGTVLAYTTNAQDITVDPKILRDAGITGDKITEYAYKLAPLVAKSATDVAKILTTPGEYAVLAQALEPLAANKIIALDLKGIYTQATTIRQYPGQTTGANVIGLVHSDGSGAAGIEAAYNSVLAGTNGYLNYTTDGNQNINPNGIESQSKAINGGTVALTLDQSLQFMVQQYLDTAVKASGARGADVVVQSVKTGQVLAMASSDTYNSADPSTLKTNVASNPATMTPFEPGSVNKMVTFAAALDKGVITPSSVVDVPSFLKTGGVVVHDAWTHPDQQFTATGILAESSNIGTVEVADKIGPQTWYDYEKAFGIGAPTGIELPGESAGYLPELDTWSDSTFANVPFGQGLSMTVLQMAGMYQTIANNGVRIPPRIVSSVTKSDGSTVATKQPAGVKVVTPQTAKTLRTMLESTMLAGGTGTKAAIAGYRVSGKTGTAQQPDPNHNGAYSNTLNWDTFAGIVPADDPQFVVAIMVDAPAHGLEGGDVAAPLFHEIATYELQHANIPPTGSLSIHVPLQVCTEAMKTSWQSNVC
jgi:cell division protein FtsI (penicillin-binding protein 3)